MGGEELCLTWDDHHRTLIGVFETLLENSTLVDCTIAAEGQYLKAHKVVLSACSPYFEMLFTQESEKNPIVVLKDIKFQDLKALIDFIYRGKVQIPEDRLQDFTDAAESLQIKGLGGGHKRNTCEKKGRVSPNSLRKESFARKRSRTIFPRTEESKGESSNSTISNKSPRLENVIQSQITDRSTSVLPSSASETPSPPSPQRKVHKEPSETRPSSSAIRSSVSITETHVQPMTEIFLPDAWIEPKTEVCMDEVSIVGSEDGLEGAMLEDGVDNEEYENSTFPSPNEVVKEESENSLLMEPVSEPSNSGAVQIDVHQKRYTLRSSVTKDPVQASRGSTSRNDSSTAGVSNQILKDPVQVPCGSISKNDSSTACVTNPIPSGTDKTLRSVGQPSVSDVFSRQLFSKLLDVEDVNYQGKENLNFQENEELNSQDEEELNSHDEEELNSQDEEELSSQDEEELNSRDEEDQNYQDKGYLNLQNENLNSLTIVQNKIPCPDCGKIVSKKHLKKHRYKHTGESPYTCVDCGKGFCSTGSLGDHRRIHTGEKPFGCKYCLKYFRKRSGVLRHMRSLHPGRPEELLPRNTKVR